jgi:hypothetical protein
LKAFLTEKLALRKIADETELRVKLAQEGFLKLQQQARELHSLVSEHGI